MKTLVRKRSVAVAAAGTLASLGLLASPAMAADVQPGHSDIVEVHCDANGDLEFSSHLSGASGEVDPADLQDWTVEYPAASPAVSYGSGLWSVDADQDSANVPDTGFTYDVDAGGASLCPTSVVIEIDNPAVEFNGDSTITLGQNGHVHGVWTFASATQAPQTYDVGFSVDAGGTPAVYTPAEFVVGS